MSYSIIDFSKSAPAHIESKLSWIEECPLNSCIMIEMPSNDTLAWTIVHCFKRNLTVVPIDPRLSTKQKMYIFNLVQPSRWVGGRNEEIRVFESYQKQDIQLAFILFTSGSTSSPKGVMLTKEAVLHNSNIIAKEHQFGFNNLHATCLLLYHCNALVMSLLGHYITLSKFILFTNPTPHELLTECALHNVKTISIVPAILSEILDYNISQLDFSSLKYFISASAPLSSQQCESFYRKFGPRLRQGYGLSEAVNFSFLMPLLSDEAFKYHYIEQHPPVGLPIEETDCRLIEQQVYVKSKGMMLGYLDNPEATNKALNQEDYLATGDLGCFRDGYLVLKGRLKEVINRGGETLYPVDIEDLIKTEIPECKEIICYGVMNSKMDNVIGANILLNNQTSVKDIYDKISHQRPPIETVRFEPVAQTSTRKPQRSLMASKMFSMPSSESNYEALQASAYIAYKKILTFEQPMSGKLSYIYRQAQTFVDRFNAINTEEYDNQEKTSGQIGIRLLAEYWADLIAGRKQCLDIVTENKGLWVDLMTKYPMGEYAQLTAEFLIKNNLLNGECLELGAGVGNTSRLIDRHVNELFIRTDLLPDLVKKTNCPGTIAEYNFNQPGRWKNKDTIFGVNTLHCADNKLISMQHIREMLKPGGILILGEGSPYPRKDIPWCLNGFYGLFDGWWDKGGFVSRKEWIGLFYDAGFEKIGYSQLRAGKYDLGGIVWGYRPIDS